MDKRIPSKYPGVRYRESPNRVFRNRRERYYIIRYKKFGKLIEEAVGWEGERVTPQYAAQLRGQIIQNLRTGNGPQSIAEMRETERDRKHSEKEAKEEIARENTSFDVLAQKYIEWTKQNKKSWNSDESRYRKHIESEIGHIPMKQISVITLEGLKQKLKKKKLSDATVKHCLVLIRQMFNRGIGWGIYQGENPIRETTRADKKFLKTRDNKRLRFLTHEEAGALLIDLKGRSQQTHDICLLAIYTGLRMGEIFSLVWQDVDIRHGVIHIRDPKNNITRQAFLIPQLKMIFQERQKESPQKADLVFKGRNGKRIYQLSNAFNRAVDKLGFNKGVKDRQNKIVPHSLRHTFASWLCLQGESLLTVKELLGHQDISTTQRYAHLLPDEKKRAVNKLAELGEAKFAKVKNQT